MSGQTASRRVRTRCVFYLPGYDPMPARSYRERYRREAARQARISGHEIALSSDPATKPLAWDVTATIEGACVSTRIEVLQWSDIVRGSMQQGVLGFYGRLARTAWIYIASGALWRVMRLRKGPVIAILYPVGILLAELAAALVLAGLVTDAVATFLPVPWVAALVPGLAAGYALLAWFKRRDPGLAWYLVHDYAFAASHHGAYPPEQETRLAEMANRIAGALESDADEVLVVGHSSGAHMAVSILADLSRTGLLSRSHPAIGLLTLGHVVPMVSFLPGATRLRADLAHLSISDRLTWIDVTAPGDGCTFALCDPVAVSGVAPAEQRWPLVISAAFRQSLSAENWARLRWRFIELHLQYLNAFDHPERYDYFAITAGPKTLAERFAARRRSPQAIGTALSPHRDTGPETST